MPFWLRTSFISLVAAASGAGEAAAQGVAGQWMSGQIYTEAPQGDAAFANRCLIVNSQDILLDIQPPDNGEQGGTMVQDRRIAVILDTTGQSHDRQSLEQACSLKHTKDKLFGTQIKAWTFSGEMDGPNMVVETMSADCQNDWCTTPDSRFPSVKPGAPQFGTRFELRGGALFDTMGTPDKGDDIAFFPRAAFETRSNEGAAVAKKFLDALAASRAAEAKQLLYAGTAAQPPAPQHVDATISRFASAGAQFSAITIVEQRMHSRGERDKEVWAIRGRMFLTTGLSVEAEVFVWAEANGTPRVGSWAFN